MNLSTLSYFTQFGPVFPLAKNSKAPMRKWPIKTKHTNDLAVIDKWLQDYPRHPWGLYPTRAFVVDVDVKNGACGPQSIEDAGGVDETLTIQTVAGGTHH